MKTKNTTICRKLLVWLLVLASLMTMAGCGSSPTGQTGTEGQETTEPAAEPEQGVPERGVPDKSNLLYVDAIDSYKKTDWTASWIWTKSCSEDSYVAFRKSFTLEEDVESATAHISAVDKYVLWVNGELVVLDGSLKRGPTPVDSYYDTVEITGLHKGENVIALLVAFNGRSGDGSIVPVLTDEEGDEYVQAGLLFEMQAGNQTICSDSSWKALRDNAYKNRVTGGAAYPKYNQTSMLAERNVFYVASDYMGDYTAQGFDDSSWENATLVAQPGQLPFGDLYSAIILPVKFGEITPFENSDAYVGKTLTEDTLLELTLPGNIQFTTCFTLEAPAGKTLTIYTDTYVDKDNLQNFMDTYVTAEGTQSYENYPWRNGSKLYIQAPAGVTFTALGYRPSGFHGEVTGSFVSEDEDMNQLWEESRNTITVCMRDTYMDCPDRERGPYMGDAANQIDAALYSYDGQGLAMTKKAILACLGWTLTDGAIPSRAPSVKPQEIPNQSLAFFTSAYHYWLHSGDTQTMTEYYHAFVNYLKLYEMQDNGLPAYRDGSWTWNDWGDKIDSKLLQVGFYYYALNLTDKLAQDLGIEEGRDFLTERMHSMEQAWREVYYTPDGFRDPDSKFVDERANAMLALSGLAGEEDYDLITQVITTTNEASPFCEKFVLEALCVMGQQDAALDRIRLRYAGMLTDEYDTLWEKFDPTSGTINHGWTAAPLYILSKYVAGIQPTAPGFAAYEIAPSDVLKQVSCSVDTPKGILSMKLESGETETVLTVEAIDAQGTVYLPESFGGNITVSGGEYTVNEDNSVTLSGAGSYTITVTK